MRINYPKWGGNSPYKPIKPRNMKQLSILNAVIAVLIFAAWVALLYVVVSI
jgi:hypothetical protein